ncbi:unnamed protein product [Thlaspi arvense]|uniref:Uncharacterized protein n=1 Tax=Thlaspi arvense TaxID=13288 RepID=A0AAU9T600_THLAR|nr:unnamed protein product [Thlaspi arvense]
MRVLLIETIFLHMYSKAMFPTSNLQKAQHMDILLNHHWGIDAYKMLLKSVKKTVENSLEKAKYPLDGFPVALHLWILESVPKLPAHSFFVCEISSHNISSHQSESDVGVVHILPKIHGDLEDTVFMQDEDDEDLHSLVDLLDKGFELTHEQWRRGVLKRDVALQYIASQSYRYPRSERARQNSRPSSEEESVEAKINKLIKMFEDGQTHIRSRLSKIEQKLRIYDPSDSIDEELTLVDVSTCLNTTGSRRNDSLNQMNKNVAEGKGKSQRVPQTQMGKDKVSIPLDQERHKSQRVHTRPVATFTEAVTGTRPKKMDKIEGTKQNIVCGLVAGKAAPAKGISGTSPKPYLTEGALVEVSGEDNKWFSASLINRQPGLGPIHSYYLKFLSFGKYENVQVMRIRPTPPPLPEAERSTDVLTLTQYVDAYHYDHWCRGYVQALLDGPEFSIHLHHVEKNLKFQIGDVKIHREWVDEAWDPPVDVDIHMNNDETTESSKEQEIAQTQMEKDERTQPMEEQQIQNKMDSQVQTPPVISTSTKTVGGTEPTEADNDDGSQEKDETTVFLNICQTFLTQKMLCFLVQTSLVVTSTEAVGGTEPTEVENDDGSQERDATTVFLNICQTFLTQKMLCFQVQTPPVVTSTETVGGTEPTEIDNDYGSQEKDETTNVKGTIYMAIVLWQPSPSGVGNQTDEVTSEKMGLSFQKDTASVVAMDTSANEESAAEHENHVKVVDMLRIRPTVANRKAKEKRVDDEGDRPAKRLKTFLRRSNRDPKQNKTT